MEKFLRIQDLLALPAEGREWEHSKMTPQFLSCEKRKIMLLFPEIRKIKEGEGAS